MSVTIVIAKYPCTVGERLALVKWANTTVAKLFSGHIQAILRTLRGVMSSLEQSTRSKSATSLSKF